MISVNPNRVKPALLALVACSFLGLASCGSSTSSVEVGGGSAGSVAAGGANGAVSADCVSGSGGGASGTVCADADGNASVKATVDDGTDVTIDTSSEDTGDSVDAADDTVSDTDTSTEVTTGGGSATTVKAATGSTCAADFPLPSGANVLSCSDDGKVLDLLATVTDVEAAYDFYLDALPDAGYKISQQDAANLAGVYGASIDFSGSGIKVGSVVITDLGSKGMTVSLQR